MTVEKKKSGGARPGSGRKPTKDKVKPIYIGIRDSVIENLGGKEVIKKEAERYINNIDDFQYIGENI